MYSFTLLLNLQKQGNGDDRKTCNEREEFLH